MKRRHFYHQSRWRVTAIAPIAHADEDGDQIETWMIGQGQETRGNRRTVVRRAWDLCIRPYGNSSSFAHAFHSSQLF
jgi:hypothetical protein